MLLPKIQVDERLFDAYTASNAEELGDERDLVRGFHFNA
jgi:hypothetical protein